MWANYSQKQRETLKDVLEWRFTEGKNATRYRRFRYLNPHHRLSVSFTPSAINDLVWNWSMAPPGEKTKQWLSNCGHGIFFDMSRRNLCAPRRSDRWTALHEKKGEWGCECGIKSTQLVKLFRTSMRTKPFSKTQGNHLGKKMDSKLQHSLWAPIYLWIVAVFVGGANNLYDRFFNNKHEFFVELKKKQKHVCARNTNYIKTIKSKQC